MNPLSATASRLERWDRSSDWRRFWWAVPPIVFGLAIWGGLLAYHHFEDEHLVLVTEVIPQTFNTNATPTLVIVDRAGDVKIDVGSDPKVTVSVTRLGAGKSVDAATDDLTSLSLHMDDQFGTVQITTGEEPGRAASEQARSNVHVTVPPGTHISVVTHVGGVTIAGVTGDIAAAADHGDVQVQLRSGARFALLDGAGSLHSDFPLATPPAGSDPSVFAVAGDGNGNALPPDFRPAQQLDLHAPNGNVVILRQ